MYLCVWASLSLSPRRCAIEEDGFNTHEENVRVICEGQVHPFKKNKVMGKILVKKLLLHRPGVERRRVGASSRENINNRPTDRLGFSYLFSPVSWLPFMDLSAACVSLSLSLYSNLFFHTFFLHSFLAISCILFDFFLLLLFFFSIRSNFNVATPGRERSFWLFKTWFCCSICLCSFIWCRFWGVFKLRAATESQWWSWSVDNDRFFFYIQSIKRMRRGVS